MLPLAVPAGGRPAGFHSELTPKTKQLLKKLLKKLLQKTRTQLKKLLKNKKRTEMQKLQLKKELTQKKMLTPRTTSPWTSRTLSTRTLSRASPHEKLLKKLLKMLLASLHLRLQAVQILKHILAVTGSGSETSKTIYASSRICQGKPPALLGAKSSNKSRNVGGWSPYKALSKVVLHHLLAQLCKMVHSIQPIFRVPALPQRGCATTATGPATIGAIRKCGPPGPIAPFLCVWVR